MTIADRFENLIIEDDKIVDIERRHSKAIWL